MSAILILMLMGAPQGADTVVVCPDEFRPALKPWLDYRARQGHTFAMVSNMATAEEIRRQIRQVAELGRLRFVVLVGDAEPGMQNDPKLRRRCVPTYHAKAEVNILWGSEPHIATDNYYADLKGDVAPEVAVGRIPADNPEQLKQIVAKILAYEQSTDFGPWRRQLNFVAGVGGFGLLADTVLESSARYLLARGIPGEYQLTMAYGSWRSPYCPDPTRFHETVVSQWNDGAWFWVYIGHGQPFGLDRVRMPDGPHKLLDNDDVSKLRCRHGSPIALFLACYNGAFDASRDCLAEEMFCEPGGPVAAIAGSRVTMPYAMTLLSTELMDECFVRRCPTIGEALLRAKQNMVKPSANNPRRVILDGIARVISPASDKLAEERAEHVLLFNLIGDPLLRLRYPKPIKLTLPQVAIAGEPLEVTGICSIDGRGTVELVVRRDRFTFKPPIRGVYPKTSEGLAEFQSIYIRANDRRLTSTDVTIRNGRFSITLEVPPEANGPCHVRLFVEGVKDFAVGAADLQIEEPAEKQ